MIEINWPLVIAAFAVLITFTTSIALPLGRWVAERWRGPYVAERDLRRQREAELLEMEKKCAILEVKLQYCEGELGSSTSRGFPSKGGG